VYSKSTWRSTDCHIDVQSLKITLWQYRCPDNIFPSSNMYHRCKEQPIHTASCFGWEDDDDEGMNVVCVLQLSKSLICWRINKILKDKIQHIFNAYSGIRSKALCCVLPCHYICNHFQTIISSLPTTHELPQIKN
jgi:hypothetical protein